MSWPQIKDIVSQVKNGKLSAVKLAEEALAKIEAGKKFNAVLRLNPAALDEARLIDEKVKRGEDPGPLAGVPYLAKDNYLTKDLETTAASNILKGYIPPIDATVIKNLREAGAILMGKTNLDAFAHGSSTENSDFGTTLNPFDESRVAGGSSGGSAAAVALEMVPFALGSDTGGSIRQPASLCGVVGFKPTYGVVSRYGVVAMASSTDCMGPITGNCLDALEVFKVMQQSDWHDSTMVKVQPANSMPTELKKLRVGVVEECFGEGVAEEVEARVRQSIGKLESHVDSVESMSLPATKAALAVYYVVVSAEVSSNLARYDGVRYGPQTDGKTITESIAKTRGSGFNAENKRRIMIGTYVLSSGYYDAYYKKAQAVRTLLINQFEEAFKKYDVLVCPTSPTTAFKIGDKNQDPLAMYKSDVATVAANLVGIPAISIPVGHDSQGLPIGLQIMAGQRNDFDLLEVASKIEALL